MKSQTTTLGGEKMTDVYFSVTLNSCRRIEEVVRYINENPENAPALAAQYAIDPDNDRPELDIESALDLLESKGARFSRNEVLEVMPAFKEMLRQLDLEYRQNKYATPQKDPYFEQGVVVGIEIKDGVIRTGILVGSSDLTPEIGEYVTIELPDENGGILRHSGRLVYIG